MNILSTFKTRVDCDDKHCSLRFYDEDNQLSVGIIRTTYYNTKGPNGLIVTIREWNVGDLLQLINDRTGIGPDEMLLITTDIKNYGVTKIKEHLTGGKL